jgi:hypothetical protein
MRARCVVDKEVSITKLEVPKANGKKLFSFLLSPFSRLPDSFDTHSRLLPVRQERHRARSAYTNRHCSSVEPQRRERPVEKMLKSQELIAERQ